MTPDPGFAPTQQVSRTLRNPAALSSGEKWHIVLADHAELAHLNPASAVVIKSPRKADGTHANLAYRINSSELRRGSVVGGGGSQSEFGGIYSVEITPDAAVAAGNDPDRIEVTFFAEPRY